MPVAQPVKTGGFYRPLPEIPLYEATYEDLECLAITLRDVLEKMGPPRAWTPIMRRQWPSKIIAEMIDMIDKAHSQDKSALTVVPAPEES
jgi:hypothetical protein